MKIGFLGNTNNYPFMLARAFRNLGHDVLVLIHRSERLHRPEYRYPDVTYPYPDWIRDIPLTRDADFVTPNPRRREAIRLLRQCDLVVLNDLGVSLAGDIGRPYFLMLTGSDLTYYCDPATRDRVLAGMTTRNPVKRLWGRLLWTRLLERQRRAVREAPLIYHFAKGLLPGSDALFDEIGVTDGQRIFFLLAAVDEVPYEPVATSLPLRTFCATRLTWKKPLLPGDSPLDFKGSDVMIRGIGEFVRRTGLPIDVHLVNKGRHVTETIELAESEGIGRFITWHDEMTQAQVWQEYARSQLVFEQFDQGIVAMAGLEAMAAGRSVIANRRPEIFDSLWGEALPVCQAVTPQQVAAHLQAFAEDPRRLTEIGERSREFVRRHFAPEVAARRVLERLSDRLPTNAAGNGE